MQLRQQAQGAQAQPQQMTQQAGPQMVQTPDQQMNQMNQSMMQPLPNQQAPQRGPGTAAI
jgi:hypothetical protein